MYHLNYDKGGNNYILKSNTPNWWFTLRPSILEKLKKSFGEEFNIIVWASKSDNEDKYIILFKTLKDLIIEENKLRLPIIKAINKKHLEYHREYIFLDLLEKT